MEQFNEYEYFSKALYYGNQNICSKEFWAPEEIKHGKYSQVGSLALFHFFALATGGCFLAAECARDAHQQAAVTQEEAADVHQHEEQQQRPQTKAHHRTEPQAAEQGFC